MAQSAPAPFLWRWNSRSLVGFWNILIHVHVLLFHLITGVQRLVAQEEASRGKGWGDRVSRHTGGGEDGGAEEGDAGAATAARQGAFGSNADGGTGEATGGAVVKEALCGNAVSPAVCSGQDRYQVFVKRSQRPFTANEPFLIAATVARWQLVVLTDLPA